MAQTATKTKKKTAAKKAAPAKAEAVKKRPVAVAAKPAPKKKPASTKKPALKKKPTAATKTARKPAATKTARKPAATKTARKPAAKTTRKPAATSKRPAPKRPTPKPSARTPKKASAKKTAAKKPLTKAEQAREQAKAAAAKKRAQEQAVRKRKKAAEQKTAEKKTAEKKQATKAVEQPEAPPPKPQFTRKNLRPGSWIVYPSHGVGKVVGISETKMPDPEADGATKKPKMLKIPMLQLHFESEKMELEVPVAKAQEAGLRRPASKEEMSQSLAVLKERSRAKRTMWSRRAMEYEQKIGSGNPKAIAEVLRDLHREEDQPEQSYSERQIFQSALERLAGELSVVDGIDRDAARTRLEEIMRKK